MEHHRKCQHDVGPGNERLELPPRLHPRAGLAQYGGRVQQDVEVIVVVPGGIEAEVAIGPPKQVEHRIDRLVGRRLARERRIHGTCVDQRAYDS